jgi:hypothetical protein
MGLFDEYFPFDPGFGSSANAARWRKMANLWCPDGVVANYPYGAAATASQLYASPVVGGATTLQPGAVFIHGYYAEISAPQTISGILQNGTIVAQVNFNTEVCQLIYRDGVTDYGSNPASNYEQDANIWEVPIWLISSGALVDIRNLISPGRGLRWWTSVATMQPIVASGTLQASIGTARIPHIGTGFLHGTMLLTFTDLSQAQSVACTLTYQWGQTDVQTSPTINPAISGGGPSLQSLSIPVSLTGTIPISQGKKTYGWRVTAGTGPTIQVSQMTVSLWSGGTPGAN